MDNKMEKILQEQLEILDKCTICPHNCNVNRNMRENRKV